MTILIPTEVYEADAALKAAMAQIRALTAERDEAATHFVDEMCNLYQRGEIPRLSGAMHVFKLDYGAGYSKLTEAAGLPTLGELRQLILGACNDGEGRWRGTSPLDPDAQRPRLGKYVVYRLLLNGEVIYIGSTGAFPDRIKAHSRDKDFDAWEAVECSSERACRELEAALIDRYRPRLNRMIPTPKLVLR